MKMEILLEPTSNKLLVGYLKDGDGDGNSQPHKGVKASANSDVMYFFTSAQDGDPSQDDVRLCLGDDLKKAQDHSQRQAIEKPLNQTSLGKCEMRMGGEGKGSLSTIKVETLHNGFSTIMMQKEKVIVYDS
ncbi:hypothetical protein Tco_1451739 [Tanacetum coccineum]